MSVDKWFVTKFVKLYN